MIDPLMAGIGMTSKRTRYRMIERLQHKGINNISVLSIIGETPRHLFVDEALAHHAYDEEATLPIGYQQTLSQPYIVARMTELLLTKSDIKTVLEIGTGSGYQTAILAQLFDEVFSIERIKSLQDNARLIIGDLGLRNVKFIHDDGNHGWRENTQLCFDAIISTAAPLEVPKALLNQLMPNGILVSPVGPNKQQELQLITRRGDSNRFNVESIEPVNFVPLVSGVRD